MTAPKVFTTTLIECECGEPMHPSMDMCGECMDINDAFTTREIKAHALSRRFLISGF